jgi:hypothetical protein
VRGERWKMKENKSKDRLEHKIYRAILPNRTPRASEGVITLSGKHSFNPLSPERISHYQK